MVRECAARSALSRYVWAHWGHAHFWDNAALCAGNGQCERTSVALIEATSSMIRPKLGIRAISRHPDLRPLEALSTGPVPSHAAGTFVNEELASQQYVLCIQI